MGIIAYIPVHPNQGKNVVTREGFTLQGDHLICREVKRLKRSGVYKDREVYRYVSLQSDCQQCPIKAACLPPGHKRRGVALSMHYSFFLSAQERNESKAYQREMRGRRTTVEGVFASLDRLGWARGRLRGLWKANCEGYISGLAHNLKKAVRRLGDHTGPRHRRLCRRQSLCNQIKLGTIRCPEEPDAPITDDGKRPIPLSRVARHEGAIGIRAAQNPAFLTVR